MDEVNGIIEKLDDLKREDPELYSVYYNRIALERLSIYAMLVDLYSSNTSSQLINQYKLQFMSDAKVLGIEVTSEGGRTVDDILKEWEI